MASSSREGNALSTSALGSYWRELRGHLGLPQEEVVKRLRARGLTVSAKQISGWERGVHQPTSINKAMMDEILGGNPVISDRLLLYDYERSFSTKTLLSQISNLALEADTRIQAEEKLKEQVPEAFVKGVNSAREWVLTSEFALIHDESIHVPIDLIDRTGSLLKALSSVSPLLAQDWIRYGLFLLEQRS